TTNFPGSQLRDWLESIGVKFGANLNAYTGTDETVYNISNVPIARESVQDSCLLILHDWANDLTLAPEEIDKERGVIHEEWRRSMQGQMRIIENILPDMYPTSKYAHRLPIGTMEIVDNFPHQALRDYYETWYRPDQQAVIVVGDIDVDRIENKIKEMFSSIEMPADAPERKYEMVPDHKGTLYGIGSDPEQQNLVGQIFFISDAMPKEMKNTQIYYIQHYLEEIIASMLNNRLNEISSKPDSPFAGAGVSFGQYFLAKTKDAMTAFVAAKGGDIVEPMQAVYREILRAQRGGFTQSEYERARNEYLSKIEKTYNNRSTCENGTYVQEYVGNFTDGEPIPGIETEWPMIQQLAAMIPLQAVNQTFAESITPDNRVVMVLAPEHEGITVPTKEGLGKARADVDSEEIAAFVDEVKSEPLIPTQPVAGTITATTDNTKWGTTEWTLSNGA
ncbi:MAG: insulinase family protein, partial [Duncaniella sp.]|nr:insulinase family protein [Duncaniella sp.]